MKDERENNSTISLSAADGIPKVSFGTSAADNAHLAPEDYGIAGNKFAAYYDGAHRLVFVLDRTLDDRKPNALLIINPIGDRKWDDILANDYDMDLETVRPKKDNKYQKLDIEYGGLGVYNRLINVYNNGEDLTSALAELSDFRNASVRRAAADRLSASADITAKSRETISKTGETMRELQSRLRKLREKLARQKKEVGKEPTKQSAAKILKTESQIDTANEKLKRAKKRLINAQRRLAVAQEDAEVARRILGQETAQSPAVKEVIIEEKPSGEDMAEEVKPLFEQEPEILDEKIAFKPIEFDSTAAQPSGAKSLVMPESDHAHDTVFKPIEVPPAPLSFTTPPPQSYMNAAPMAPSPVVETPTQSEPPAAESPIVPAEPTEPRFAPQPVIRPESVPEARPVSPIGGTAAHAALENARGRPTALYYIMLVVLIVLSIFTLWLYQKNTADTVPELKAVATPEVAAPPPAAEPQPLPESSVTESPFIVAGPPEAVRAPIAEPKLSTEDSVVVVEQYDKPEDIEETEVLVQPEPAVIEEESSIIITEPTHNTSEAAPTPEPVSAPNPVVNKPAYNVGGERDEMFVADDDYESEYYADARPAVLCDDGTKPDSNGCCSGETYKQQDNGDMVCCSAKLDVCYPPLF
jgi:hypothetical protein